MSSTTPQDNFKILEATPTHIPSCTTILPRSFHSKNAFVRKCFPDTPLVRTWWTKIFYEEIASENCHVFIAVDGNDTPSTEVLGILCMRLLDADDNSAGFYSLYPFTPDHDAEMFRPAMDAMVEGRRKVFFGTGKRHWLIELLGVDEGYQGIGVGRRLMEKGFEIADFRGEDVFVEANAGAVGMYIKMGFESQGSVVMPGEMRYEEFMLVRRRKGGM